MSAALDGKLLHDQEIVAIVTVDIKPLPPNGNLDYLFIPGKYLMCLIDFLLCTTIYFFWSWVSAHDVCEQDLLGCFRSVFEFIEKGIKHGGVLVHWYYDFLKFQQSF